MSIVRERNGIASNEWLFCGVEHPEVGRSESHCAPIGLHALLSVEDGVFLRLFLCFSTFWFSLLSANFVMYFRIR